MVSIVFLFSSFFFFFLLCLQLFFRGKNMKMSYSLILKCFLTFFFYYYNYYDEFVFVNFFFLQHRAILRNEKTDIMTSHSFMQKCDFLHKVFFSSYRWCTTPYFFFLFFAFFFPFYLHISHDTCCTLFECVTVRISLNFPNTSHAGRKSLLCVLIEDLFNHASRFVFFRNRNHGQQFMENNRRKGR